MVLSLNPPRALRYGLPSIVKKCRLREEVSVNDVIVKRKGQKGRWAEGRRGVGLLSDPSRQSLTHLQTCGEFVSGFVHPRTKTC